MKRLSATIATLILGLLITSTVIGFTVQTPSTFTKTSQNETFTKQIGGTVFAVAKQGNYAYIGIGKSLVVLDVQDPTNPQQVGQSEQLDHIVYSLTISGTTAFAPQEKGLRIFDLSDPTDPQLVDTYDLPSTYIGDVVISGTLAFIPEKPTYLDPPTTGGLRILDVSDPLNISQVTIFGEGDGVEAIAVDGNYAYLAFHEHSSPTSYSEKTLILDISTINSPTEVYRASNGTSDVTVYNDYLYIIDNGLEIYDISTPASPIYIKKISVSNYYKVFVSNDKLYIVNDYYGIEVYDLTDPENPSNPRTYKVDHSLPLYNLTVDGNTAYLAYSSAGLRVVDVQSTISEIGRHNAAGYPIDAFKKNGYVYLLDYYQDLQILDVSDPLSPEEKGSYSSISSYSSMQLINQDLFLVSSAKFDILDATNYLNPTLTSNYITSKRIVELIIHGDYAYVGRHDYNESSLEIVNIADTTNPIQVATLGTNSRVYRDGEIKGSYFFMSENSYSSSSDSQFHVIDISNPHNPQIVKTLTFSGNLGTLAIIGNYAYLARTGFGIQIINISNPLTPVVEGVFTVPDVSNYEFWVQAVDGELYAATIEIDTAIAQDILDVSNPISPVKVGEFNHFHPSLQTLIEGVEVNGYNYYPSRKDGLLVYQCHDCVILDKNTYLPLILKN
ncbi:MAG: hypothetical protein GY943_38980 [Chloroflexi bacterium]|nr:hypothetical protein [Chloroflexota bacterium]